MRKPGPINHGTPSGYQQHRRRGEAPCVECRQARTAYEKQRREDRAAGIPAKRGKAREKRNRQAEDAAILQLHKNPQAQPTITQPPSFLSRRGQDLWADITSRYDLPPASLAILGDACRAVDVCERLSAALANKETLWFELGDLPDDPTDGVPIVVNGMIAARESALRAYRQALQAIGVIEKVKPRAKASQTDALMQKLSKLA